VRTPRSPSISSAPAAKVHGVPGSVHADNGTSMTSKPVAQLLVDLGVTRSHSRPRVSNDNPYSEAQFKTLKYAPAFPGRFFGSLADACSFCDQFFSYYNHEHRHAGIGLHTPASVPHGTDAEIRAQRARTLDAAYTANPARFRHRKPEPPRLPKAAWGQPAKPGGPHSERLTRPCLTPDDIFRSPTLAADTSYGRALGRTSVTTQLRPRTVTSWPTDGRSATDRRSVVSVTLSTLSPLIEPGTAAEPSAGS